MKCINCKKCRDGKNNRGRWTNHPASQWWQTLQLFRSNKPRHHSLFRLYIRDYLEATHCFRASILPLQYCKTWPESREIAALRYPLCTVKQKRSFCLVTYFSSLHHRSFLLLRLLNFHMHWSKNNYSATLVTLV